MSKKRHNTQHSQTRQNKKEQFQSTGEERFSKGPLIALVTAVVIGMTILYLLFGRGAGVESSQVVTSGRGDLRAPVAEFSDGNARYYTYTADGKQVGFFIVKSSDGIIRSAFNTCDICYKERLGYFQQGDEMVCRTCGKHFPSVSVNEVKGGCNPVPLQRFIEGNQLIIRASDMQQGSFYF